MRYHAVKRTIKLGFKSLWMHRLRSSLTTLGIIFGVCSVIAMLAIGEGASQATQEVIARLGSTNLIIESIEPPKEITDGSSEAAEQIKVYGLKYKDAEIIRNTLQNVEVVVPLREIDQEARNFRRSMSIKILGTIPWHQEISPMQILKGRFLCSTDLHLKLSVCVIDELVAERLFGFDDPIGQAILVRDCLYKVVGVFGVPPIQKSFLDVMDDFKDSLNADSETTGKVYIPLSTAQARYPEADFSFSGGSASGRKVELHKITVKVESIDQVLPMRSVVDALLKRLHENKDDYRIIVPLQLLREAKRTQVIFSIVLGSIAAISLIVGGIGIMNIMLATVSERTREIGIRRALGATKRHIMLQFLSETLILTLTGGAIGIFIGIIIPKLVTHFAHMPTIITGTSLILAFGISSLVGLTFGLYPAYNASNMDPIESLRHE